MRHRPFTRQCAPARSATRIFWEVGAFTNLRLLGVVGLSVLVQVALHHIPATQQLFQIRALSLEDWVLALLLALVPVSTLEIAKLLRRAWRRGGRPIVPPAPGTPAIRPAR